MFGATIGTIDSRCYAFEYFTTVTYPLSYTDEIKINRPELNDIKVWGFEDPSIYINTYLLAGALTVVIAYISYTPALETFSIYVPSIVSGTLVPVISYISYAPPIDTFTLMNPYIIAGILQTVIFYIYYTTGADVFSIYAPDLITGSLT